MKQQWTRKRGYIEVMKQLWDELGYKSLGIKAQNLNDQAARLKGLQELNSVDTSSEEPRVAINGLGNSQLPTRISDEENNQNFEKQA